MGGKAYEDHGSLDPAKYVLQKCNTVDSLAITQVRTYIVA